MLYSALISKCVHHFADSTLRPKDDAWLLQTEAKLLWRIPLSLHIRVGLEFKKATFGE